MSDYKVLTEAIARFEAMGIDVPADMLAAVEGMRYRHTEEAAIDFFKSRKGMSDKDAIVWQEAAFTWAEMIANEFAADVVNRGRGKVLRRGFTVDTPHGTFKVDLSETVTDTEE